MDVAGPQANCCSAQKHGSHMYKKQQLHQHIRQPRFLCRNIRCSPRPNPRAKQAVGSNGKQHTEDANISSEASAYKGPKVRQYKASDGRQHLGSALGGRAKTRPFPGPPLGSGPPLRVLPIGGLGEIGMNCMLVGCNDRYVVIDAGLMFPDVSDLGMQKILPDTAFLHAWRDKIEAVIITHGHEDHIGALPWVVPALDPSCPVYCTDFVLRLVKRRLTEFSLFDESRFKLFDVRQPFKAGPFEVEAIRVTHSIPDSCGLVLRSEFGSIVHTGDWKIDEKPVDGQHFDRETFEMLGREPVALLMSDSTNVLSPGRTTSESVIHNNIADRVLAHDGKGRVIVTQFASNMGRLYGVKAAADASGRKIAFIGPSLNLYLEAAFLAGRAPFDPRELLDADQLKNADPNKVLIVTTGSQAEPRAQLPLAARGESGQLRIRESDLILYSAKIIPGNEPRVSRMINDLARTGARVLQGRGDMLHTTGHAHRDELVEVLRAVRPQHFLPVHGELAFLAEHARLAKDEAGVTHTSVIKNGQMLGVWERRNRNTLSTLGSMAAATLASEATAAEAAASATAPEPGVHAEATTASDEVAAVAAAATAGSNSSSGGEAAAAAAIPLPAFPEAGADEGAGADGAAPALLSSSDEDDLKTAEVIGQADLVTFYHDGLKGCGTAEEMNIEERTQLAMEGVVVVGVEVTRLLPGTHLPLKCINGRVRLTTRGMWTGEGRLMARLQQGVEESLARLPVDSSLAEVERFVVTAVKKLCRTFNGRRPEVICIAHEHDAQAVPRPRSGAAAVAPAPGGGRRPSGGREVAPAPGQQRPRQGQQQQGGGDAGGSSSQPAAAGATAASGAHFAAGSRSSSSSTSASTGGSSGGGTA